MRRTFRNGDWPFKKARQSRLKTLATKLAILLHGKTQDVEAMRRPPLTEMSLFGSTGIRKYLTTAERERFEQAMQRLDPAKRLFCQVLLLSGGRVSEVLSVTPGAINIDDSAIVLLTLKRRKKVVRQVPLPPGVVIGLDEHFHLQVRQANIQQMRNRLWPWSRTTAWRIIKNVMREAGIATLAASPKGLRHTFGVTAFHAMVPPHLVQRWLGHASLRTTTIYGDVLGQEEREIAERMWVKRRGGYRLKHERS